MQPLQLNAGTSRIQQQSQLVSQQLLVCDVLFGSHTTCGNLVQELWCVSRTNVHHLDLQLRMCFQQIKNSFFVLCFPISEQQDVVDLLVQHDFQCTMQPCATTRCGDCIPQAWSTC